MTEIHLESRLADRRILTKHQLEIRAILESALLDMLDLKD